MKITEKPILIDPTIHDRIKIFCEKNGFKISKWCSIQLEKALNEQETKNAK